ncbi:MAG: hypothetical protein NTV54_09855 [Ignavibacteriales bacterium]|nr:hypothetical protein [Ignavibacteriales bacterium]
MCFSATASFAGGIAISSIGVAALRKVQTPSQTAFATIPLFFGVQQISEGFLWLALTNPGYADVQKISTHMFLILARVIWPTMMPLSVLLMEENNRRRKILSVLLAMGLSVSLYYVYCLLFLNVIPNIAGHHIQYISDFSESLAVPVFVIYFIAAVTPLFISSIQRTRPLGVLMFVSCLVTAIFYVQYLTSVWCFFAALISGIVFWILRDSKKEEEGRIGNPEIVQVEMGPE